MVNLLLVIPILLLCAPLTVYATTGPDNPNTETNENDLSEIRESCHQQGQEDGGNGPFNKSTWHHCGDDNSGGDDAYYEGFIDGCEDAGNTKDICIKFTD